MLSPCKPNQWALVMKRLRMASAMVGRTDCRATHRRDTAWLNRQLPFGPASVWQSAKVCSSRMRHNERMVHQRIRGHVGKPLLVVFACALIVSSVAFGQNVGALRTSRFALPQNDVDREVITLFFGAFGGVQGDCSESLEASLEAEGALAACATFDPGFYEPAMLRQLAELAFDGNFGGRDSRWLSPWQAAEGFGSIRRVEMGEFEYVLALDETDASVIRFLEP